MTIIVQLGARNILMQYIMTPAKLGVVVSALFTIPSNATFLYSVFFLYFILVPRLEKIYVTSGIEKEKLMVWIFWREGRPLAPLCHCSQFTRGGGLVAGYTVSDCIVADSKK